MSKYGSHLPVGLALILATGAIAFFYGSQAAIAAPPKQLPMTFTPPPIISTAAAQRQVHFHIAVPRSVPTGFRLVGARVSTPHEIKATSDKGGQSIKAFGYGIVMTVPPGSKSVVVLAVPGSPGAKAGIPSTPGRLLAVNGVSVHDDPEALAKVHKQLSEEKPPITITYKDSSDNSRIAVVSQKSTFVFVVPSDNHVSAEPSAALLYSSKKGSFAVIESKVNPNQKLFYAGTPWTEKVGDTKIIFYVSRQAPNATFVIGGVKYDIAQAKGYITEDQIKQIAASI